MESDAIRNLYRQQLEEIHELSEKIADATRNAAQLDNLKNYSKELSQKIEYLRESEKKRFHAEQQSEKLLDEAQQKLFLTQPLLQKPKEKFSNICNLGSVDVTLTTFPEGKYVQMSDKGLIMNEYSREEVIGKTTRGLCFWANFEDRDRIINMLRDTGRVVGEEVMFKSRTGKFGTTLWVSLSAWLVKDADGTPLYYEGIVEDITERKKVADALRESERIFCVLFNKSYHLTGLMKTDGTLIKANSTALEFAGIEESDAIGHPFWETPWWSYSEEQRNFLRTAVNEAAEGDVVRFETYHLDAEGRLHIIDFTLKPVKDENNDVVLLIPEGRDISEFKRSERILRENEKRLYSITMHIQGVVFQFYAKNDGNYGFSYISERLKEIFGISADIDTSFQKVLLQVHEEDRERLQISIKKAVEECMHWEFEGRFVSPTGKVTWFQGMSTPTRQEDRMVFDGILLNITERKKAEEKFAKVFMTSPDCIIITRMSDGLIIDMNIGFEEIMKWNRSEILGRTTLETNLWDNPSERTLMVEDLGTGRDVLHREFQFRRKDMSLGIGIYSARSIQIEGEECILFVMQDITERRRLEEDRHKLEQQLIQAQKMESLGTLAGGIAHDFNNILSPIIGFTELIMDEFSKDNSTHDYLSEILSAANRASDLVSQILTFSRKSEAVFSPIALRTIINESLKLLRSVIPSTVEIRHELADSGLVMSNPTQIHQIIMNLCTNAVHAMDQEGGIIRVSLHKVDLDEEMAATLNIIPGAHMRLIVSDSGNGIPPEIVERIFEPYFTTKKVGHGTGLGLSVVHGIVKSHGGAIICKSVLKKGTDFTVYLPEIKVEQKTKELYEKESLPTGTERILFIDDETALIYLAEEILSKLRYKITTKTNSIEALDFFRERPHEFDLIITDMTMPGLTGDRLAQKALEIRPDIPVILCSGYSDYISEEKAKSIGIREFVMKPLGMNNLAKTIRRVLDEE